MVALRLCSRAMWFLLDASCTFEPAGFFMLGGIGSASLRDRALRFYEHGSGVLFFEIFLEIDFSIIRIGREKLM